MYIYMKVTTKQRSSYIFRNVPQLSSLHRLFFLSPIQLLCMALNNKASIRKSRRLHCVKYAIISDFFFKYVR